MRTARLNFDGRVLSMQGPKNTESLWIKNDYPWTDFSESLFAQLGTMHMIAPYMPREIRTDFSISPQIKRLIRKMYASVANEKQGQRLKAPQFKSPAHNTRYFLEGSGSADQKVVILYSAGKDSMWNLMWAIEEYGVENVLVVHIRGLNKNNGPNEYRSVLSQQTDLGFRHLHIIDLNNGSLNTGFKIMRSREMFIAGLAVPLALEFGANKIIREGYFDCTDSDAYFTGIESNMNLFNSTIGQMGIPVGVYWRNRDEMLTIKDLYDKRPEWMPHVCNCFTVSFRQNSHRKTFQGSMPTFPLYDSQCGVCVKCKITNLARVLYDPVMITVNRQDIRTFLTKIDKYIRDQRRANEGKMSNVLDMIAGPFMRDYAIACRRYNITARSLEDVHA